MVVVIRATTSKTKSDSRVHTGTDTMSGDLEDFLKRAAERRQAKAAQSQQKTPPKRVPPQYSDSRAERITRPTPDDEIVEAQVVSASGVEDAQVAKLVAVNQGRSRTTKPTGQRRAGNAGDKKQNRHARQTKTGDSAIAEREPSSSPYDQGAKTSSDQQSIGFSAENLLEMLKSPGGVQQAILLREIFDRPEHRW